MFIVHISSSEAGLLDYFAVDPESLPTFCLVGVSLEFHPQVKNGENDVSKFAFRGAFEDAAVREYIESYFRGDLKPYFKSEPIYKEREGDVRILVHDDFEQVVYDPTVNVLVEFVTNVRVCAWSEE